MGFGFGFGLGFGLGREAREEAPQRRVAQVAVAPEVGVAAGGGGRGGVEARGLLVVRGEEGAHLAEAVCVHLDAGQRRQEIVAR